MLKINRRKFVLNAASAAGFMLGGDAKAFVSKEDQGIANMDGKNGSLMNEILKYRKIDAHAHVGLFSFPMSHNIEFAERLGIEKLMISKPMTPHSKGLPEEFRACNDVVLQSVKQYPDKFIGMLTLNPLYLKESLEEIKRCIDNGMAGMKLYNHVKINDPVFYPIIEKFIDLKMIMLMHSGIGYSRVKLNTGEPKNISLPEDFVDVAKRYPEAMFQFAHIGGGIDWEYACKTLKNSQNVYVDLSGSNNEANMIDFALKYLGENRLLFGCDNSFYQGVGHVFSAKLTDVQRKKIFFDNYNDILKKTGRNIN